jgi:hypothetical protein
LAGHTFLKNKQRMTVYIGCIHARRFTPFHTHMTVFNSFLPTTVHTGAPAHDGLGRAALVRRFKRLKLSHKGRCTSRASDAAQSVAAGRRGGAGTAVGARGGRRARGCDASTQRRAPAYAGRRMHGSAARRPKMKIHGGIQITFLLTRGGLVYGAASLTMTRAVSAG